MARGRGHQRGITLIEVLVSILILGTAVATLLSLFSIQTANVVALQQNALARIAAENAMVQVVAGELAGRRNEEGGVLELGGQPFFWTAFRTPSPYEGLELLTVQITAEEGEEAQLLADLSTLRPQAGGR